jgi:predicted permease
MLGDWLKDLRHGARMLWRQKGFTVAAALSLAVGTGLNTTMFSVVNAVLLRGTLVREPERLVELYSSAAKEYPHLTTSYADLRDIREGADAFSGIAGHAMVRGVLTSGGRSELVTGEVATADYFDVLGIHPALGRGFLATEDASEGSNPVVVLSHGLWQRRFGGKSDVLGSTLELSNVTYSIVGVAPPGFSGTIPGFQPEFWVPAMMVDSLSFSGIQSVADSPGATRIQRRGHRWLFVSGRLAEGRSLEQARAQVETIYARLRQEHPESNKDVTPTLMAGTSVRFHPMLDGYVRAASAVLLVAVTLVLTIACANVANMLLARSAARRREFAVRAAIGAGRGRIVRQLLVESVLLAGLGGALGLAIAFGAGRLLSGVGAEALPIPLRFSYAIDGGVLLYALGASLATALLFGLAPALTASRVDLVPALRADATGEGPERRRLGLRDLLVGAQLATSLVLLIAGALLGRGLLAARSTDLGFDPRAIAALSFNLQMNGYDLQRASALRERVLERLRGLPAVEAATLTTRLPLAPDINMEGVRVPGHQGPEDDAVPIDAVEVGPDYFEVAGIPIVQGRAFGDADREGSPRVAIVNETMARKYWPGESALGKRFYMSDYDEPPYEVVGVSRDHKVRSVGENPRPYLHTPWLQSPSRSIGLAVRTKGAAAAALPALRQAILELEPEIAFTDDGTAAEIAELTLAPTRIGAAILGAFGFLALLLAGVGLYGLIAYSVSRRTREVGVRMALGARPGDVLALVLRQGLKLALAGTAVGALVAAGLARVLESLLYGVSVVDSLSYAAAVLVLLAVAALANALPAYRASRIEPMRALRYE